MIPLDFFRKIEPRCWKGKKRLRTLREFCPEVRGDVMGGGSGIRRRVGVQMIVELERKM